MELGMSGCAKPPAAMDRNLRERRLAVRLTAGRLTAGRRRRGARMAPDRRNNQTW
jgi:hypothetical protein